MKSGFEFYLCPPHVKFFRHFPSNGPEGGHQVAIWVVEIGFKICLNKTSCINFRIFFWLFWCIYCLWESFLRWGGGKQKKSEVEFCTPHMVFFFSHKVYFITKKRKQRHKIINRNEKQIMRQSHKWIYKSEKECQSCFSSKIMKTSFMHTLTRFPFTKNIKMWKKNQENTNYLMAGE